MDSNSLYYGDNLDILRRYVQDESVDLIYLDPPFKSDQTYNILFQEKDGSQSASQIKAFGDTWHWDETAARSYEETVEAGGQVAEAMQEGSATLRARERPCWRYRPKMKSLSRPDGLCSRLAMDSCPGYCSRILRHTRRKKRVGFWLRCQSREKGFGKTTLSSISRSHPCTPLN